MHHKSSAIGGTIAVVLLLSLGGVTPAAAQHCDPTFCAVGSVFQPIRDAFSYLAWLGSPPEMRSKADRKSRPAKRR